MASLSVRSSAYRRLQYPSQHVEDVPDTPLDFAIAHESILLLTKLAAMDLGNAAPDRLPGSWAADPSRQDHPSPTRQAPLPTIAQPSADQALPITVVPMHCSGPYVIMHISHYLDLIGDRNPASRPASSAWHPEAHNPPMHASLNSTPAGGGSVGAASYTRNINPACSSCHRARKPCDRGRPCGRCVQRGEAEECSNRPRKRKREAATTHGGSESPANLTLAASAAPQETHDVGQANLLTSSSGQEIFPVQVAERTASTSATASSSLAHALEDIYGYPYTL
ncbi:hypothetical protein BD309DRAFT_958891 [Dichomitus squalens]|uniref:Uncharacterized protein n=1 Tax=Dichomitus squalens TaxID=114155 RepID=A0A4Q9PZ92_9APHY|nr:hypothetical protein BD309DRAFT_958891 [Dichomitus squalens]TBU60113.1 hypothetical protein BD310DRAFT_347385 [Dichomitus squalens]